MRIPFANIFRARAHDAGGDEVGGRRGSVAGGVANLRSGQGGASDKTDSLAFYPTIFNSRVFLETLYVESWAAGKFIDMPVDEMFLNGRQIADDDEEAVKAFVKAERELRIVDRLSKAMKAGRLYGCGMAAMMTNEAPLDTPLDLDKIKEGDFESLYVFDRFDVSIQSYFSDIYSIDYSKPDIYWVQPRGRMGGYSQVPIHSSRILRFDGRESLGTDGWSGSYHPDWGVSAIIPALADIKHDAGTAGAIAHLVQEASIPVIKHQGLADSLTGRESPDEVDPSELAEKLNTYKSIYRTIFIDANDEFERVTVNFTGLADTLNQYAERLAFIADIPVTRFLSKSPQGMNATGESDMKNYAIRVAAMQEKMLTEPMRLLDTVLARHIGLKEPMEYEWNTLLEMSKMEVATLAKERAIALNESLKSGAIDENDWRKAMTDSGDKLFGVLEPLDEDDLLIRNPEPEPVIADPKAKPPPF